MTRKPIVAVIGGGSTASREGIALAEEVGFLIARADAILVCGGLNGVMEASAKGAKRGGGFTVGILPTGNKADANHHIDLPIATAMSTARNLIIVRTADAIVAVNGSYGTLSEMAHAFDLGKTVFALRTWPMDKAGVESSLFVPVDTPREAVERALAYARKAMDAEKPGPALLKWSRFPWSAGRQFATSAGLRVDAGILDRAALRDTRGVRANGSSTGGGSRPCPTRERPSPTSGRPNEPGCTGPALARIPWPHRNGPDSERGVRGRGHPLPDGLRRTASPRRQGGKWALRHRYETGRPRRALPPDEPGVGWNLPRGHPRGMLRCGHRGRLGARRLREALRDRRGETRLHGRCLSS